ncbi:MAG: hypothetical protein II196_00480, partial [Spirochaetales bacterium]|nr:hypothetical protein [Spirochaetales bacterium]
GKFYGGDIAGLTAKLDYLKDLGINAIWLTAPYEQIHGFCIGGSNEFFHYPYHGYYQWTIQTWTQTWEQKKNLKLL